MPVNEVLHELEKRAAELERAEKAVPAAKKALDDAEEELSDARDAHPEEDREALATMRVGVGARIVQALQTANMTALQSVFATCEPSVYYAVCSPHGADSGAVIAAFLAGGERGGSAFLRAASEAWPRGRTGNRVEVSAWLAEAADCLDGKGELSKAAFAPWMN